MGSGTARSGRSTTVTLELTPEQANIILLAKDKGELQLTYTPEGKGNGGVAIADADRATLSEILGLTEPKKEPAPYTAEMYFGSSRSVISFKDGKRIDSNGGGTGNGLNSDVMSRMRPAPVLYSDPNGNGLLSVPTDNGTGSGNSLLNRGAFNGGMNNANRGANQGGANQGGQGGQGGVGTGGLNNGFSNFSRGEGL
jgi:hypothetical protein